jgi:hypothetical protein
MVMGSFAVFVFGMFGAALFTAAAVLISLI